MLTRTAAVEAIWRYGDIETVGPAVIGGLKVTQDITQERVVYTVENDAGERLVVGTRELMYHANNGWRIRCGATIKMGKRDNQDEKQLPVP